MALTSFHLFPSLPFELRQDIYLLATPHRIVHIQECIEQDYEDFSEELRTTVVQFKLDPSLSYFAFNWRKHIPSRSRQPTLESFGFSGGKKLHQPWEPSTSMPEISLHWVSENPEMAWELIRRGYLYSNAPIPALLHMSSESRTTLMSHGYQLAFQTRSSGPRTWFNFDRDVLFLGIDVSGRVLSGSSWNVGQFDPGDMRRVRKLALKQSINYLCPPSPRINHDSDHHELSIVLRLFGSLQELLLVGWTGEDMEDWAADIPGSLVGSRNQHRQQDAIDSALELKSCIAAEEIDTILDFFLSMRPNMQMSQLLKTHIQKNGLSATFFSDMQLRLEQWLKNHRDSVVGANNDDGSITLWEIPKIKAVHVLPQSMLKFLSQDRLTTMEKLRELKVKWASIERSKALSASPSSELQNKERAFTEEHWPEREAPCCGQCAWDYYESIAVNELKKWWIQEGPLLELSHSGIY